MMMITIVRFCRIGLQSSTASIQLWSLFKRVIEFNEVSRASAFVVFDGAEFEDNVAEVDIA